MDCHKAQAKLDLTTLGREAHGDVDAQSARRHLEECDACHQVVESSQRFDAEIARAMSDVPIPAGLADRLSASVNTVRPLTASVVDPSSPRARSLRWVVVGMMAAFVPWLIWSLSPHYPTLNEASVRELAVRLGEPSSDSPATAFASPSGWNSIRSIQLSESARIVSINGVQVPVRTFVTRADRRSPSVTGSLMRLSSSQWQSNLDASSFSSATIQYESFGTWVAWREGDSVFVCLLREDAHAMQRLQDIVAGNRTLT